MRKRRILSHVDPDSIDETLHATKTDPSKQRVASSTSTRHGGLVLLSLALAAPVITFITTQSLLTSIPATERAVVSGLASVLSLAFASVFFLFS